MRVELNSFGQPVKPLCFRREDDELLALGYPHLRQLIDGHKGDQKPAAAALMAANQPALIPKRYRIGWPREVAQRFVRAARSKAFQDWTNSEPTPAAFFETGGAVSAPEARELLAACMEVPGCTFQRKHEDLYYLLEAMVGTEVVVDAILGALEAFRPGKWTKEAGGPDRKTAGAIVVLGFLVLRLTPAAREKALARLKAISAAARSAVGKGPEENWELTGALGMVLDGSKASKCQGTGPYDYLDWHLFADDDLDKLRQVIAAKASVYAALDVRFVYLAGPEVLRTLGKHRPLKDQVLGFLEDVGMVRDEAVLDLVLEYVGKPSAKGVPLAWLRSHADFVRPLLATRKTELAKMALRSLD